MFFSPSNQSFTAAKYQLGHVYLTRLILGYICLMVIHVLQLRQLITNKKLKEKIILTKTKVSGKF